ncbi:MAG: DUF2147 domain-containing protein [Flavobacteriaceae bacterium]|jgi:uncharacterized protein (DUF2147 family)|nr:DUF2147 domain-containing protein [Flavobacteriaceae bacterium]
MINIKIIIITIFTGFYSLLNAQSIVGEWETFDDVTGDKLSIVQIYNINDIYYGKITHLFEDSLDSVCNQCEDDNYNKPIIGLVIIKNLIEDDGEYNDGTILDPNNGKSYKCYLELIGNNKLKLRGYIGFSILGRTQYWQRKK